MLEFTSNQITSVTDESNETILYMKDLVLGLEDQNITTINVGIMKAVVSIIMLGLM